MAMSEHAPGEKRDSVFSKFGTAVKKAASDRQSAKEDEARRHAESALAAGSLVTSGVFGTSTIEIYDGGYVRVAAGQPDAAQASRITPRTPYERLRSIVFTPPEDQHGAASAGLQVEGAVGQALNGLMKSGKMLLRNSAPGLIAAGVSQVAANQARKSLLTIVTDRTIHNLTNQAHNGVMKVSRKEHNQVALALESAGNAVLGVDASVVPAAIGDPHYPASATDTQGGAETAVAPPVARATSGTSIADRLRELAELHRDGILSDEEFVAAKAKVLGSI